MPEVDYSYSPHARKCAPFVCVFMKSKLTISKKLYVLGRRFIEIIETMLS